MDIQPVTESTAGNESQPLNNDASSAAHVNTQPSPAPQVSVYPSPTSGFVAPSTNPVSSTTSNSYGSGGNSFDSTSLQERSLSTLAFGLSCGAVGVIPLLIFVPSLIKSMTMVTVWLVVVALLSIAGLTLGAKSQKNTEQINVIGLIAIVASAIMLINCLIIGSYYIKVQLALNAYSSKYKSKSSSSTYDSGL